MHLDLVEAINKAFVDNWGCAPEAISISIEEVAPDNWVDQVEKAEIEPNAVIAWLKIETFKR